jgi:hypothetical protein
MDGGGEIGGGSVKVNFHVDDKDGKPTSEVKLNDDTTSDSTPLTFTFPPSVDLSKRVNGQVIRLTAGELKPNPISIAWGKRAGQTPDPPQPPPVSAKSASQS